MAYGELKVDSITFTNGGTDTTVSVSGLVQNPTFSGDITVTGTISGDVVRGGTLVSGATVTGNAAQFTTLTGGAAGFTTVTGTTVTGTTANFATLSGTTVTGGTGQFTSLTSTTATITSGVFASGTAAAPSVSVGTTSNGLYSPGTDQVALSTNGTGRLFVDSSGNVGIGTTSPGTLLHIASSSVDPEIRLVRDPGSGNINSVKSDFYDLSVTSGRNFIVNTGGSERARIDSSGRLLVGTSSSVPVLSSLTGAAVQVNSNSHGAYAQTWFYGANNQSGAAIMLAKSRNTTYGSYTAVQSGDSLGGLYWAGDDGSDLNNQAASILCWVDGTPGTDDMPGRLVFSTTADGASSPTERLRINSGGKLTAPGVYAGTTTGGGPVYVESDGDLLRFTSSRKYKTDIETLEDFRADAILNCRPVWYRSLSANDIKTEGGDKSEWGWYGFIAEEVAEIDPRLVNWATKDAVVQQNGSTKSVERDPADYEAEGVRYETFVPLLLNLIKRQKEQIEAMEARLSALEAS